MLDDILAALRYSRNTDAGSPRTTIGKGREVVRKHWFILGLVVIGSVGTGVMRASDAALFSAYAAAPFFFDSALFLRSLPVLGRILPRATVLIEVGMEVGLIGVSVSLSLVYWCFRKIGMASMGWSWLKSRRKEK